MEHLQGAGWKFTERYRPVDPQAALAEGGSVLATRGKTQVPLSSAEDLAALAYFEGDKSQLGGLSQPALAQALGQNHLLAGETRLHDAVAYRKVLSGETLSAMIRGTAVPATGVNEAIALLSMKGWSVQPGEARQVLGLLKTSDSARVLRAVSAEVPLEMVEGVARLDLPDYKGVAALFKQLESQDEQKAALEVLTQLGPRVSEETPALSRLLGFHGGNLAAALGERAAYGSAPLDPDRLEITHVLTDDMAGSAALYARLGGLELTPTTVRSLQKLARNLSGCGLSDQLEYAAWCQGFDRDTPETLRLALPPVDVSGLTNVRLTRGADGRRIRGDDDHPTSVRMELFALARGSLAGAGPVQPSAGVHEEQGSVTVGNVRIKTRH